MDVSAVGCRCAAGDAEGECLGRLCTPKVSRHTIDVVVKCRITLPIILEDLLSPVFQARFFQTSAAARY